MDDKRYYPDAETQRRFARWTIWTGVLLLAATVAILVVLRLTGIGGTDLFWLVAFVAICLIVFVTSRFMDSIVFRAYDANEPLIELLPDRICFLGRRRPQWVRYTWIERIQVHGYTLRLSLRRRPFAVEGVQVKIDIHRIKNPDELVRELKQRVEQSYAAASEEPAADGREHRHQE